MIAVTCSYCGVRILVPDNLQGREGICFGCGKPLQVPAGRTEPGAGIDQFVAGTVISERYRIEKRIGKGGMGVVYRAEDTLVREPVALKFLNLGKVRSQRALRLFIREAQIARRLRHEHIVAVHDVGNTEEGVPYLSMEYLPGASLRAYLKKRRTERKYLDVRFAVHITAQVLAALDYAHRTVVHRDLKPENIILMPGEQAKVLDFGLAVALDIDETESRPASKEGGPIIGTWAYASPEQRLRHDADNRSDLYAVGLILHELLTLRTPLDKPVEIEQCRSDVPPSIVKIIRKATAQTKSDRWQSAGLFRDALMEAYRNAFQRKPAASVATGTEKKADTEGMVFLDGGNFLMGCDDHPSEAPQHEAYVKPFYIDRYPVTVRQYGEFIEATGHPKPKFWGQEAYGGLNQPIVGVTWDDAMQYAAWAGKKLPNEAQWEFAARGRENRLYPWGPQEPDPTLCNFGENVNMPSIIYMHEDAATPDGIADLAGNVFEWTRDPFLSYRVRLEGNAAEAHEPRMSVRGGCWKSPPHELRCSFRKGLFPESQEPTVGFRCVVPAE